ncbi:hypothetical protein GF391_00970 [Candidatus Uhrbacteria bacterium]|nr:hypothetical protein [Candidatus Uhrbacteria bacterium]
MKRDGELRAVAGKGLDYGGEVIAELKEDTSGFNTLAALIGADTTHSVLLRKTFELLCLKMFTLGMEAACKTRDSSPSFPPP